MKLSQHPSWQEVSYIMKEHRDMTIAQVDPPVPEVPSDLQSNVTSVPNKLLSPAEIGITETAPEQLVADLAAGILTSLEVTNAFLRRAGLAQKLVNCITELLPQKALLRARELDAYYAEHKKPMGPLHGLPISVKEHVGMEGLDQNCAFVSWVGKIAKSDAQILTILWNAGCVFYARTTEPQSLMMIETSSNIYGTTLNPHNTSLTPGGSSGGEGALIALRGSCLGVSTDIAIEGGSIRVPAANCGNYGLRPTSHRIPLVGLAAPQMGSEQIWPVIGPQSTTLEGIKLFMSTVLAAKPWMNDPSLVPLSWKANEGSLARKGLQRIKIGVIWSDKVVKPQSSILRALEEMVAKLRDVPEIEVVDWKPWKHDYAHKIVSKLYLPDGGRGYAAAIDASGEPWHPLTRYKIRENPHTEDQSIHDVWHWTMEREIYRAGYAQAWNDTATGLNEDGLPTGMVDVILCPVGPGPAPLLNTSKYWGYTSQWNLLDYPALVFPVTKMNVRKDVQERDYTPMNEDDKYYYDLYDEPERFRDAPISLQLVGRNFEDEKVIEAFEFISEKIGLPFMDPLRP
ncbi:hypothetical protein MMC18_001889 [Xylographa bjoerkii]|nr:hypothetical protein [Xylographa bjoerkii]